MSKSQRRQNKNFFFFTLPISGEHVNVIFLTLAEERVFVKYTFTVQTHFLRYNGIKNKKNTQE